MTTVTSSPAASSSCERMPVELLFRAKSDKRVRKLEVPKDLAFSVAWAEKGSYRQEHILAFLRRTLPEWTEARHASSDYGLLYMDVARSHVADEVVEFCWSRGFVLLFHYGCTTGVAQVNDTDLHGALERIYCEIESQSFHEQQEVEPGCVARRPQDVLNDAAAAWRLCDHGQGRKGHWRNGLAVKLDGSEDHLLSREALSFWQAAEMATLRSAAIADVDAKFAAGQLKSFGDWQALVQHPEDPGIVEAEGAEFEGDLEEGEKPWFDEGEAEALEVDDDLELELADLPPPPLPPPAVDARQDDDPADVEEALAVTERLHLLKRLREDVARASCPAAYFNLDKEITQLERGLRQRPGENATVNKVLRRSLEKRAAEEAATLRAKRMEALNLRREKMELKKKEAAEKQQAAEAKAKKDELKKKLDALPKTFTLPELAVLTAKGAATRRACLERLKLGAPPLPEDMDLLWEGVRDGYNTYLANNYKEGCGRALLDRLNRCLFELKEHYNKPTRFNAKGGVGGDPQAFVKYFREMQGHVPKFPSPASAITL